MERRCEGACEEHTGNARKVHVFNPATCKDWGYWHYCKTAIACDRKRGFLVREMAEVDLDNHTKIG